jgi:hypothetical protein
VPIDTEFDDEDPEDPDDPDCPDDPEDPDDPDEPELNWAKFDEPLLEEPELLLLELEKEVDVTEEDDLAEEDEIGALEGAFVFVN